MWKLSRRAGAVRSCEPSWKPFFGFSACGLLIVVSFAAAPACAGEWPQFLGPARTGVSPETGLLEEWPESGPPEIWRAEGGVGMSGLAVQGGRLFTLVQKKGHQWLISKDAGTGRTLWETAIMPEYENSMGNGPRGTPAVDGDRVFAFTGEGVLAACRFEDGRLLWKHDVVRELGGEPAEYGMACSPLIVGSHVVVVPGVSGGAVAAYDLTSGKLAWKAGDDTAGYSSPTVAIIDGKPQIVVFAGQSLMGLAPADGEVLWRHPYKTNYDCNIATPIAVEGRLFISSGENHGSALLAIEPKQGRYEVREVWKSHGPSSVMRNEWQTSVLLDGFLYGWDNVGGAGPVTHLTCIRAATGERLWRQTRFGKGNFILAEGKLFMTTLDGELVLAKASPDGYQELGRKTVLGMTRQAPSLAGGLLYVRDDADIVCFDVRARPNKPPVANP